MKITADTNVLLRAVIGDDPGQRLIAHRELGDADIVAIGLSSLCEFVWVLSSGYGYSSPEIAETIRNLINSANVSINRAAVEAGLMVLDAGGDFADGVIAFEGRQLGGETFVSFDRRAAKLLRVQGLEARQL